jgi:chemotaxis protein methyltransferase CheR
VFEIISQSLLPKLINKKDCELRIWSAGCSAGEEAYSIAILIDQALKLRRDAEIHPMIFGTDIDENVLKKAKEGIYTRESLKNTKLGIIDKYFTGNKERYNLSNGIKSMVDFSINDLLSDKTVSPEASVFGSFDMILCRNVQIYFSSKHQKKVIQKLYQSLAKGGYLILGDSEMLPSDFKSKFKTIDPRNKIYQK